MIRRAVELGYQVVVVPAFRHAFGKQSAHHLNTVSACAGLLSKIRRANTLPRLRHVERFLAARRRTTGLHLRCAAPFQKAAWISLYALLVGPDIAGRMAALAPPCRHRPGIRPPQPARHPWQSAAVTIAGSCAHRLGVHRHRTFTQATCFPAAVARYIARTRPLRLSTGSLFPLTPGPEICQTGPAGGSPVRRNWRQRQIGRQVLENNVYPFADMATLDSASG